ncbi:MAG: VWA domain-containing protein [Terriglobales bacterium]|jgi:VWFA-related protein
MGHRVAGGCLRLFPVLLVLLRLAAPGQNPATPPPEPSVSVRTPAVPASGGLDRRIALDVQVTDKSGTPVRGLQAADFSILDDKQPQKIVSFQAVDAAAPTTSDPPVEVVLVVDGVNTGFQTVSREREQIRKFLLQNGGKLAWPVSLVVFSDQGTNVQNDSSRDGNALAALYDRYETGLRSVTRSQGIYGAEDRFSMSLNAINWLVSNEKTRPGRKLVIWLSGGWPLLSGPNIQLSQKELQQLFQSVVAVSTAMRQADVTLYTVDPLGLTDFLRSRYYEQFLKGVSSASRVVPGNLGLQVLSVQSGGRVFTSSNDLTAAIADCVADAGVFYVLSFDSLPADHADEYHALRVTVDKPGMTARARTGYYDQR